MTVSGSGNDDGAPYRPSHVDALFGVLANHRRREVVRALRDGARSLDDLAGRVAVGSDAGRTSSPGSLLHVRTALVHQHLPKLVHAGLVEWDREADEVSLRPTAGEVDPLLRFADRYETVAARSTRQDD